MVNKSFINLKIWAVLLFTVFLAGCSSLKPYKIYLSPPPDYYAKNKINPLVGIEPFQDNNVPVFYATNRKASQNGRGMQRFYSNTQSTELKVGEAWVRLGTKETSWDDLEKYLLGEEAGHNFPLEIIKLEEFGQLNFAKPFFDRTRLDSEFAGVDQRLAQRVNEALAKAKKKEITLFVHGFNVPFDNPVLTSAELWYYQGFEGVGMSFSWPSSQKMLGYLDDIAKTHIASRHLTYLLRFLAVKTDAKKINIVAHSAGTRVLGRSLTDISLICGIADLEERKKNIQTFKLGKIIFASGDLSRDDMGIYMEYGILDLSSKTIIYTSANDKALSFSDWLWNQERIGQLELDPKKMTPVAFKFLSSHPELEVIDATDTPNSKSLYGHVYFLESPWVSSDLLLALNLGLSSEERGLVREEGKIVWKFPKDYKANPVFEKLSLKGLY